MTLMTLFESESSFQGDGEDDYFHIEDQGLDIISEIEGTSSVEYCKSMLKQLSEKEKIEHKDQIKSKIYQIKNNQVIPKEVIFVPVTAETKNLEEYLQDAENLPCFESYNNNNNINNNNDN